MAVCLLLSVCVFVCVFVCLLLVCVYDSERCHPLKGHQCVALCSVLVFCCLVVLCFGLLNNATQHNTTQHKVRTEHGSDPLCFGLISVQEFASDMTLTGDGQMMIGMVS